MAEVLMMCGIILIACILANRISFGFGVPALLLFMALGMVFGSDGIFKIDFDNYALAERICSIALIFIMFYGGFGANWRMAKPVAVKAGLLASFGVVATALITCIFCHYVLRFPWLESFLLSAVMSSTDAATVFSILRSKKLGLKSGSAPLLEIESGSNDPTAYMLTVIALAFIGNDGTGSIAYMIFAQVVYGAVIGVVMALFMVWLLSRLDFSKGSLDLLLVIAVAIVAYALPSLIGGNGYLSVYLLGIIIGNSKIPNKKALVLFFDGITGLAQIVIFFLLGLLAFPSKIPGVLLPSVLIFLFLTFGARPIAVAGILAPWRCKLNQIILVAWSGLRGASSIVFAIVAMANAKGLETDVFHIVFCIALFSVGLQGTLLPAVAKKLDMVDEEGDVLKTFNDYQEDASMALMRMFIPKGHNWVERTIEEVHLPTDSLALLIKRGDESLIPRGDTKLLAEDILILNVPSYDMVNEVKLREIVIDKGHEWKNKCIEDIRLPSNILVAMIKREKENIIPRGKTKILEKDILVIYD